MSTVVFGAKTLCGHAGHKLGYTGSGTLAITAGNGAGIWAINANELVLAGTADALPAVTPVGSYPLTVSDGTVSLALTATIAPGERSVVMRPSDGIDSGELFFVMGLPASDPRAVVRGETVRIRDGSLTNPDVRNFYGIKPPAGFWAGTGEITIRPDTPFGATLGGFSVSDKFSGPGNCPLFFTDILFEGANNDGRKQNVLYLFAASPTLDRIRLAYNILRTNPTSIDDVSGIVLGGDFCIVDHNQFLHVNNSCKIDGADNQFTWNDNHFCSNDGVTGQYTRLINTDNLWTDRRIVKGGHPDASQFAGPDSGTSKPWVNGTTGNRDIGIFDRNYIVDTSKEPWDPATDWALIGGHGAFFGDTYWSPAFPHSITFKARHNIYIGTEKQGISSETATNSLVANNTILRDLTWGDTWNGSNGSGDSPNAEIGMVSALTGNTISRNLTNHIAVQASTQGPSGLPTLDRNVIVVASASAYAAMFVAPAFGANLTTRAAIDAAVTPKDGVLAANGGAMNPDGSFAGKLLPDGSLNPLPTTSVGGVSPAAAQLGLVATRPVVGFTPAAGVAIVPAAARLGLVATRPVVGFTPPAPVALTPSAARLALVASRPAIGFVPAGTVALLPAAATLGLVVGVPAVSGAVRLPAARRRVAVVAQPHGAAMRFADVAVPGSTTDWAIDLAGLLDPAETLRPGWTIALDRRAPASLRIVTGPGRDPALAHGGTSVVFWLAVDPAPPVSEFDGFGREISVTIDFATSHTPARRRRRSAILTVRR